MFIFSNRLKNPNNFRNEENPGYFKYEHRKTYFFLSSIDNCDIHSWCNFVHLFWLLVEETPTESVKISWNWNWINENTTQLHISIFKLNLMRLILTAYKTL